MRQLVLRTLLVLLGVLLLMQTAQLASALWLLRSEALLVSGFLWSALAFKGVLLLVNLGVVALLWRLSGFGRWARLQA